METCSRGSEWRAAFPQAEVTLTSPSPVEFRPLHTAALAPHGKSLPQKLLHVRQSSGWLVLANRAWILLTLPTLATGQSVRRQPHGIAESGPLRLSHLPTCGGAISSSAQGK